MPSWCPRHGRRDCRHTAPVRGTDSCVFMSPRLGRCLGAGRSPSRCHQFSPRQGPWWRPCVLFRTRVQTWVQPAPPTHRCSLSLYCRVISATINLRGNPGPRGNVAHASVTQLCGSWRGHFFLSQGWTDSSCPAHWPGPRVKRGSCPAAVGVAALSCGACGWSWGQGSSAWSRTCLGAPAGDLVLPSSQAPWGRCAHASTVPFYLTPWGSQFRESGLACQVASGLTSQDAPVALVWVQTRAQNPGQRPLPRLLRGLSSFEWVGTHFQWPFCGGVVVSMTTFYLCVF